MLKKIIKDSKGDTIIEVLLSIAVISLVLVISYSLANRNSQYIQQSQEHGEAQKISEQQLELLRSYLTPDTDWGGSGFVCFNDASPPVPTTDPNDCNKGVEGRYSVRITVTDSDGDGEGDTYTAHTNWSSLTSVADQSVELSYKLPASLLTPDDFVPPPTAHVTVVVKKIPQLPTTTSNPTPPCSNPATQNANAVDVTLQYDGVGGGTKVQASGSDGSAVFSNLTKYGQYTATASATRYQLCTGPPANRANLLPDVNPTINLTIRPICNFWTTYTSGWAFGNRRADLDGYYVTNNGGWPNWNTQFVAGNIHTSGNFWYVYSGTLAWWNPQAAYYWLWEANWYSNPTYHVDCPS